MKRSVSLFLGAFILSLFSLNAMGAELKVGVVDIQEFQQKSRSMQKTRMELKKKFEALQQKLDQEKKILLALEEDYKKQSMMLSLDAKEGKKRALDKKRRYYKYLYEDLTQEMKETEVEATKKIGKELEKVVETFGTKEGYVLIFERRALGLIYFADAIDITDRVIQAYDRMKQ